MSKRNYNVFFNTHTVSGIVISVALYVIFFAGAFALFKEEIAVWEENTPQQYIERAAIDYDFLLDDIAQEYELQGRDIRFNLGHTNLDKIYVLLNQSKDTVNISEEDRGYEYFSIDIHNGLKKTYEENYSLGEFLYRLHFFHQIPYVGLYLSGFISLFFLFAIVTGVIVHWKKIVSNFYHFNPKVTLKRIWTDAHTALGVIGLPFQFIYAITGTYFGLSILVLLPANFLYNNDQDKLMQDLRPERVAAEWVTPTADPMPSVNEFVTANANTWDHFHPQYVYLKNYGGVNAEYQLIGELDDSEKYLNAGSITLNTQSGKTKIDRDPHVADYLGDIQLSLGRLHFANFGPLWVRVVYFILALITCFVIISGVLIWIEARNKKSMSLKQRLYTAKVGHIYMGICLSLFPITALFFLVIKLLPPHLMDQRMTLLYMGFFGLWLLASIFYRYKRDNYFTNKSTLLLGSILGFCIPLANGLVSGQWLWKTYGTQYEICLVDALWLGLATVGLFAYFKIKPNIKAQSAFSKHPIDYKNRKALLQKESASEKPLNPIDINHSNKSNEEDMKAKIALLWLFLAIGFIIHHVYGLATVYTSESLYIESTQGETPMAWHVYRILFEGLALVFALLSLQFNKKGFWTTALVFAILLGLYNSYHFVAALLHELGNLSEIVVLAWMVAVSVVLIRSLNQMRKSL